MYCRNCGTENRDDAKFCRKCGTSLSKPHKHSAPRVTLVVVIALACIGFLGFLSIQHMKGPHQDIEESNQECLVIFDGAITQVRNVDEARKVAVQCADQIGMQNASEQLGECTTEEFLGETYYRFDQQYEGVPVYGRSLTLNVGEAGECQSLSSDMLPVEGINTSAERDEASIRQAVLEAEPDADLRTDPELVVFPEKDGGYTLAYIVDVVHGDTWKRCFVSAETASIIATEQLNSDENVGSMFTEKYGITAYDASKKEIEQKPLGGTDENGTSYTFKVESDGSYYFIDETGTQLEDDNGSYYIQLKKNGRVVAKKAGVSTVTVNADGTSLSPAEVNLQKMSKSDDNTMALINNTITAMDFYDDVLGRKSYNGTGGNVTLVSNAKITWEHNGRKIPDPTNAYSGFTTPYQTSLVFGYENSAPLDTVGHEFTHSVEESICAMEYAGESGALKEGTSDIIGELIEDYQDNKKMDGSCDWKHGSRNLVDPNSGESTSNDDGRYPASYRQSGYWGDTNDDGLNNDHGNVHKNSTVISHAAYLMCKGGLEGEALTTTELAQIQLASFYMLTKRCPFALYTGVMERKASDLLTPEKAERVKAAFHEVGISSIEVVYADRIDDMQDEQHTTDEAYAAYASKLEEYLDEFGQPNVRAVWNVDEYMCSAEGVCVAELIDFDADGSDELLVVYYDKDVAVDVHYTDIDGNEHERDLNDGSAYVAEVWSYANGSLKLAYRQPAQASNGGWAYLSRLAFDDRKSWLESEDYEGSHYIKLWEFAGQDSSMVHYYEIRDEYTSDMTTWIDGAEDSRGIDEWRNDYGAERVTYRLINKESATDDHEGINDDGSSYHNVYGCIELTKETMHRLGITMNEGKGNNESGKTDDGTYILSGTVRVHKEDFGGQRTDSVVSIVLDDDVPYEYEYKGTVQAVAHDVLLATTGSKTFGADRYDEWAQYDGQHITVECDGLQGTYHDASYWKVDTIATGKIRLLSSSSQPISDTSDSEDEYIIHLTGANLVLPEALRGKVDLTVTNNGFEDQVEYAGCGWFLAWNTDTTWVDEWRASGEPSDYADVSSETLPDGTQLIFGYGNDLICQVEIIDPEGNRGVLVTSGFEKDFCVYHLGMNEDQVTACRELQDAVTGGSADDSSVDNAFAFLRECAKGLTFTDG